LKTVPADLDGGLLSSVLKALPVWTADGRLRLLRWKDGKAKLEPLPNLPDVPMEDAFVAQGAGTRRRFSCRFTEAKMLGVHPDATR